MTFYREKEQHIDKSAAVAALLAVGRDDPKTSTETLLASSLHTATQSYG